ncbi:hypothetical protein L211DRAFT_578135 [Terfezia boudieri ATCC MYA-4762]|uniref:Fungal-type protein kinase domain-containing protein n=1 Tax=Terfezia boudieri ATCC MYA-4762 TaxID=1051890 RepID=A0A3N4LAW2_9PEZI|nr:hypothetical protein L211DRAFT_578135 [Terfezia boudieri ATCC MYA-4762]
MPLHTTSDPPTQHEWTPPPPRLFNTFPTTTPYYSTPIKRKACALPIEGQLPSSPTPGSNHNSSSAEKRRRLASDVCALLRDELNGHWVMDGGFLDRFLLSGKWAPDEKAADLILNRLAAERRDIIWDSQEGDWKCVVPGYSDLTFVKWFCEVANGVVRAGAGSENNPTPTTDTSKNIRSTDPTWLDNRNTLLRTFSESRVRPDFILASPNYPIGWSSVLLVGEHASGKSPTRESLCIKLAQYAEQVFMTQPFRSAVLGIITSNTGPKCEFWRFDRGGAVGSTEIIYDKGKGLKLLVRSLLAVCRLPPRIMGFHTKSISWDPPHPQTSEDSNYPLGNVTNLTIHLLTGESIRNLRQIFSSPGIVSRGTCVWKGLLLSTTIPASSPQSQPLVPAGSPQTQSLVAVKYAWRSTHRSSEAAMYLLASSRGVQSLSPILCHAEYEDISQDVRLRLTTPQGHNRHYTQLVLGTFGKTIFDPTLTPLEVARALLAAVVIHAELFFTGRILHRDLSINNIIALQEPRVVRRSMEASESGRRVFTKDTSLYGCLIDLDYAVDISPERARPSTVQALERTGTYPFIAIQILTASEPHRYRHDLESLLYVLLWLCIYPCAPSPDEAVTSTDSNLPHPRPGVRRSTWHPTDPLKPWFSLDPDAVAAHKVFNIVIRKSAFEELLGRFKPGFAWDRFKNVARRWREQLWEEMRGTGICNLQSEMEIMASVEEDEEEEQDDQEEDDEEEKDDEEKDKEKDNKEKDDKRDGRAEHRRNVSAEEVKIGVGNWDGFMGIRKSLEKLVRELEKLESKGGEYGSVLN